MKRLHSNQTRAGFSSNLRHTTSLVHGEGDGMERWFSDGRWGSCDGRNVDENGDATARVRVHHSQIKIG